MDSGAGMRQSMSDSTMPAALCAVCGHIEAVHYTYIRNGVDTAICKQCDPATELFAGGAGNVEAPLDYSERIDFAEHVFVSVAALAQEGTE